MSAINTGAEWRAFLKQPGAKAECASPSWLVGGCPKCANPVFQVTCDAWAYCTGCSYGFSTDGPFARMGRILDYIDVSSGKPVWQDEQPAAISSLEGDGNG